MRLLVIGGFTLWAAAVAAQAPQTPADHPSSPAKIEDTPSGRTFHYIEPFPPSR